MILTIASLKGGVGKTTTAVHLAAYLAPRAPTLLIDGDQNRSALQWASQGHLPFNVVDEAEAPAYVPEYRHVVIDTAARPEPDALAALARASDLLIIPTTPGVLSISTLLPMVGVLREVGTSRYKVLLTMTPTNHRSSVTSEARAALEEAGLPLFAGNIRYYAAFEHAAMMGKTVLDLAYGSSDKGWQDYHAVGKEIVPS
jgi:chromosome partitioning protein